MVSLEILKEILINKGVISDLEIELKEIEIIESLKIKNLLSSEELEKVKRALRYLNFTKARGFA